MFIYHITSDKEWNQAHSNGTYLPTGYAKDGFIHCSNREQVVKTANRFYPGQTGLVLLKIDTALLTAPVKVENLDGGSELFPHIYGALPVQAVSQFAALLSGADGFEFPASL